MGVLLSCDVPGCPKTTMAVVRLGRAAPPDGWWMQPYKDERMVVACCDKHFDLVIVGAGKRMPARQSK